MDTTTQGTQQSNYVLYDQPYRWDPRDTVVHYSFHHGSFSLDAEREGLLGPTLDTFDPEFIRQAKGWVREAMDAWERVCGVRFVEIEDHPYSALRIGSMALDDSDGFGGTLGVAWRWPTPDQKALIVLDPYEAWDATSFYDAMLHELGHVLGIRHSDVSNVVMSGPPYTSYSYQLGRDALRPDDIAAAQALFGPPARSLIGTASNGTAGNDTLIGNAGNNAFQGGFGNDVIHGREGDDTLMGNGAYWTHWDNPQNNHWSRTFDGTTDRDVIHGGAGNDFINGNAGADVLYGGSGNDTIYGGQNEGAWTAGKTRTNTIHLRDGQDVLFGGDGDDFLNGNMGIDLVYGGDGNDLLRGGQDDDLLSGGFGHDTLYGDLESDFIYGGPGNDVIVLGNDLNAGDGASDTVLLLTTDSGRDTIYGFEAAHDVVLIDEVISSAAQAEALGLAVFHYLTA